MKCVNHPQQEAEVLCHSCKEPVCGECRITLGEKDYCRPCLEARVEDGSGHTVSGDKSALLSFLLSIIPGVGYMYLGLMNRGLQTLIIFFGTIFVADITRMHALAPLAIPVLVFYSIFDTLQLSRKIRDGVPVQDKPLIDLGGSSSWQNIIGYTLLAVGLLALVNNIAPHYFSHYWLFNRVIPPLLIIGAGVFILYRNFARGREHDHKGDN